MSTTSRMAARWSGRAGTLAFVVAALAVARAVDERVADPMDLYSAPHVVEAVPGEEVDLRTVTATVEGFRVGTLIDQGYAVAQTPAAWLVIDARFAAKQEDTGLGFVEVLDAQGRSYQPTRSGLGNCYVSGPGRSRPCSFVVEMPPTAIPGSTVRIAQNLLDQRHDALLEVPVTLDASAVEAALAQDEPMAQQQEERVAGDGR